VRDFIPYQQEQILRAKVLGQYPMEVPGMKISVLCPTRNRPENVKRLLASIAETSTVQPEVVFYVDNDDNSFPGALEYADAKVMRGERLTLSDCWNKLAAIASGEILMQAGDDIVFKTKGWDDQVRRAFAAFPDRLIFVHGDDKAYGSAFGTHGFLHRAWMDAVGYFCPPYFSADCADTWLNEVANQINRRVPLNFVTEHLHPYRNQAGWDKTYEEAQQRRKNDKPLELYAQLAPERKAEAEKLKGRLGKPWQLNGESISTRQPELAAV
jgi:glycosyltransferase involved in cell wall biosynthesis